MQEEILNMLDIEQSVFTRPLNIIFEILIEMYNKRGLANVQSDRDDSDLVLKYVNTSIEILKFACLFEVTKTMLELSYIKIVKEHDPTKEELLELTIIKHLIPYIQQADYEYIIDFQNYFCTQDTIMNNCMNLKAAKNIAD